MKIKKSTITFWLIIIISGFFGGLVGFLGNKFNLSLENAILTSKEGLLASSPYFLIAFDIITMGLSLIFYIKAKKLYADYREDDDLAFDKIDKLAGLAIAALSIGNILNLVWCGFVIMGSKQDYFSNALFIITLIIFLALGINSAFMQRRYIEFTKRLFPEKKGDALDLNFQKNWLATFDEQEQQTAHKAAFKVYSSSPTLFCVLVLLLLFSSILFDIGILPFIVLGIIWLTQTIIYLKECIKS